MNKMREEFEKVAKENGYDISKDEHYGFYKSDATSDVWLFWRKSRAALVVELPDPAVAHSSVETLYTEDVCNALERAGVRYE